MAEVKVRYRGASDTRIISQDDLKAVGVDYPKDLVWTRTNRWSQMVEMTEDLEQVLRGEGSFTIEVVKDDGSTGPTGDPDLDSRENVDDTGNTIVDAATGQVDKKK